MIIIINICSTFRKRDVAVINGEASEKRVKKAVSKCFQSNFQISTSPKRRRLVRSARRLSTYYTPTLPAIL